MGEDTYTWLIPLWTHLPVPVTKVVGPWIRKAGFPNKGKSLRNRGVSKRIIFPLKPRCLRRGSFMCAWNDAPADLPVGSWK
jgi:hypothetical protein